MLFGGQTHNDSDPINETWSMESTRFWLQEANTVAKPTPDWDTIADLFHVSVFRDTYDPSIRGEYVSFWTVLRGLLLKRLGKERLSEIIDSEVLYYCEATLEAVVAFNTRGAMSIETAQTIQEMDMPLHDDEEIEMAWVALKQALLDASLWAATLLCNHRSSLALLNRHLPTL
jgi:hypothetical protein